MSTDKTLEKIKDAVEEAIRPIVAKGANINAAELDVLTKAVCTIDKIQQLQDGNSYEDYSRNRSYDDGNSYNSYDNGNSYRRGRSSVTGRYISRDAMPHFDGSTSRRFYDGEISRHDNGYSGHSIKDRMIAQLEKMYDEAQTEHERNLVDNWMRRIATEA